MSPTPRPSQPMLSGARCQSSFAPGTPLAAVLLRPWHVIAVEIRFDRRAPVERHLALHGAGQSPHGAAFEISGPCVGAHTSQPFAVTAAVQFIGSIVACAWNGDAYSRVMEFFAAATMAVASPLSAMTFLRKRGCKTVALPGVPGSREFMEDYETAVGTPLERPARQGPGTVAALIVD